MRREPNEPFDEVTKPTFRKYKLIASLGRGGMADVYLAVANGPMGFQKLIVLKQLREGIPEGARSAFRTMFLDEARLAARLNHPNLIQTYEVGERKGKYFLAMEYLDGQSLRSVVKRAAQRGHKLPAPLAVRVVSDALSGLHYAHELCDFNGEPLSIIHRDISPHNIFLTYEGQVKLIDFGVAKAAFNTAKTEVGVIKGKTAYMAPEQAMGKVLDKRADIFAIGIVLWELLAGKRLMMAGSAAAVLYRLLHEPVPSLTEVVPGLDARLAAIVDRALRKNPEERFATAQQMRNALEVFLTSARWTAAQGELGKLIQTMFRPERDQVQQQIHQCMQSAWSNTDTQAPAVLPTLHSRAPDIPLEATPSEHPLSSYPKSASQSSAPRSLPNMQPTSPILRPLDQTQSARGTSSAVSISMRIMAFVRKHVQLPSRTPPKAIKWPLVLGLLGGASLVGALLLTGWNNQSGELAERSSKEAMHTADKVVLRLHGSKTVGAELAPALVEAFWKHKGAVNVTRQPGKTENETLVSAELAGVPFAQIIELEAEGTSNAFNDISNGLCDIGMASRKIKESEVQMLKAKGFEWMTSPASEHVLALDGIAVIVHSKNPMWTISLSKLRDVFTGNIKDWSELSNGGGPIHVYARTESSGSYETFKHLVLGEQSLTPSAQRFADCTKLTDAVASDGSGIGFSNLVCVRNAKMIGIFEHGSKSTVVSAFTIATEDYPLTRRLYLYTPSQLQNPFVRDFVLFALSSEGQRIVNSIGLVNLSITQAEQEPCELCSTHYRALTQGARRLSVTFRWVGNNDALSLDNRALRDLDRLIEFVKTLPNSNLLLLGFSDNSGNATEDLRLSRQLASKVDEELRTRGIRAAVVEGLGQEMLITSNTDESGREKNRRVEVWVQ